MKRGKPDVKVLQFFYWPTILGFALVGGTALGDEDTKRELDAHAHGHGSINLVTEGEELVIELEIPGANVVGFEHAPNTDEQKAKVEQAVETFRKGATLFAATANAKCELEDVAVTLGAIGHGDSEHEEHDTDKHEEHETEKHEEHETKDGDEGTQAHEHADEGDSETHSELHATYVFHCENPAALAAVDVKVFEFLLDAEALDAQVVTANLQSAVELTPDDARINLSK